MPIFNGQIMTSMSAVLNAPENTPVSMNDKNWPSINRLVCTPWSQHEIRATMKIWIAKDFMLIPYHAHNIMYNIICVRVCLCPCKVVLTL